MAKYKCFCMHRNYFLSIFETIKIFLSFISSNRYYLNGGDAFKLKLWVVRPSKISDPSDSNAETASEAVSKNNNDETEFSTLSVVP
jgi:hypothetical protein